ncbi:MAG: 3-oxoacyl-ACP reductase FabG [Candidatus Paraimprobicoccus trichonymphae]|uniref:3-oxoacyl-ACP reductase FabG n=1 Tax=Candidatus Paraimprobicoccus trichonymphae TaxID=3033793 RepID=A0AA48I044_9FIRM|nr:MAG: 3-oxoacyl-ACP reductase FabG [Candidatus Paraimprobicoccus trichonymphae]
MSYRNKTVIITGASRGIGARTALEFAKLNYNLIINYNTSRAEAFELKKKIKKFNENVYALKADVSKRNQAEKLILKTLNFFENIDVLVNNAGIAQQKLFTEITLEEWKKIFEINVESVFNCTQFALKNMIKNKKGKIINISSIWGLTGASCEVHYSASKASIIGLTKALAKELGPSNIQVNCIVPGVISTDMIKNLTSEEMENLKNQIPLGRFGKTFEIANLILFLASENSNYITGEIINISGGFLI